MKKKLFYFFIFLILVVIIIFVCFRRKNNIIKNDEINLSNEFKISNLKYYSTANAISNTTNYQNPEWNLNIYQYTDIAIYLDRLDENINQENYIKSLEISNVNLNFPDKEELYYINPKLIGKSTLDLDTKIDNVLEYNVINTDNSENEQNYNIPIFFQDCSNPITLRFVNHLRDSYKVSNDRNLKYNGSLISELGLNIDDLDKEFSFNLKITTKDGKERNQTIKLNIPFESGNQTILDGDFEKNVKQNIQF